MIECEVCACNFNTEEEINQHFRDKRKNKEHAEYINNWVRLSFHEDEPLLFLAKKHLQFSKQSLNEKWKRWYSDDERKSRGNRLISVKNTGKLFTPEQKMNVSNGLKRAYQEGKKLPPMKGKVAHNKGKPCSEEQKLKISATLLKKHLLSDSDK